MEYDLGTQRGWTLYDNVAGLRVDGRVWDDEETAEFFVSRLPAEIRDRLTILRTTLYVLAEDGDIA